MKCKNCKQHAIPLYSGLCYKCSSDRLQVIKGFSDQELYDEIARRQAKLQADDMEVTKPQKRQRR